MDTQDYRMKVERPVYEQEQLNKAYDYNQPITSRKLIAMLNSLELMLTVAAAVRSTCRSWRPGRFLFQAFPVLHWMGHYRWKEDFVNDLVAGFTVAVMHIPQGMAYALLGNVPPILGIYMAFFPVLVYFIFGTSRHVSMGTFAVICLMTGKTVTALSSPQIEERLVSGNITTEPPLSELREYTPIQVATAVTFMVGIYQLLMYILRLGIVCTLLSETLVNGFTTGAAVHVLSSQIKDLLGVDIAKYKGPFKVVYSFIETCSKITTANVAAIIISAITMVVLVLNNEFLKPYVSKVSKVPVPIELLVVVAGTLVSTYTKVIADYDIVVVGTIPTGLPTPTLPPFSLLADVALDSFTITMVAYTVTMSMALIFAQKLSYEVDSNQELLAQGAGNIVGSFFSCMPFSASLSRSLIQQTVGGKTQLASIVSCCILLCILLWVGPFFEPLPRCVLASIIVVALKGMLMQALQLPKFWRLSTLDGVVWLATFITVVFIDIDYGLLAGIVLSLVSIFIQGMKPYTCLLAIVPSTDLYLDVNRYKGTHEVQNIKIFHYCGGLNFATRDHFKSELFRLIGLNPQKQLLRIKKDLKKKIASEKKYLKMRCLILDFSALSYIDPSGVNMLRILGEEFNKIDIPVYVSGSSCPVYENLKRCGLFGEGESQFKIFPTVHDAVVFARTQTPSNNQTFSVRL
uniref:STAS domain-containing protein n=1 Tax=Timema monikensis TaxID=170555 RepID=A0A7R9EE66_9NEOP|nr:unnamed protein product [Timema monikensis]